jgi:hemerythrin-like domain-containing protein
MDQPFAEGNRESPLPRAAFAWRTPKEHTMADPLAGWQEDHNKFSQLLDLLEAQVDAFHRGDRPNYDLMGDIVFYMRNFADCVHHPREDVAFGRLLKHDRALQPIVDRLLEDHRVIASAGAELLAHLQEVTGDVMTPRGVLEAAAANYIVYYRNHLATEEREIMPIAARVLTIEDWTAVAATIPTTADPLFGDDVDRRFRVLREEIDREASISWQQ